MKSREELLFQEAKKTAQSAGIPIEDFLSACSAIVEQIVSGQAELFKSIQEDFEKIQIAQKKHDAAMSRGVKKTDANSPFFL